MDAKTKQLFDRIERAGATALSPHRAMEDQRAERGYLTLSWVRGELRGGTDSIPPEDLVHRSNSYADQFSVGDGDPIYDDEPDGYTYYQFDPGDADAAHHRSMVLWRDALFAYDSELNVGAKMQLEVDDYIDAMLDHAAIHGWAMLFTDPKDLTRGFMDNELVDFAPRIQARLFALREVLVGHFDYDPSRYAAHWQRWSTLPRG